MQFCQSLKADCAAPLGFARRRKKTGIMAGNAGALTGGATKWMPAGYGRRRPYDAPPAARPAAKSHKCTVAQSRGGRNGGAAGAPHRLIPRPNCPASNLPYKPPGAGLPLAGPEAHCGRAALLSMNAPGVRAHMLRILFEISWAAPRTRNAWEPLNMRPPLSWLWKGSI